MIIHGDCLDKLKTFPTNYFDAVVTDPPYGLGKEPDPAKVMKAWSNGEAYRPRGAGFMGKEWDAFVPGPEVWREIYRVLKPGGHVLSFFGTRTYDWGTMAMRFAGFEIRDQLQWIYGSGFPKSHDISKAIDKAAGAEREVVGEKSISGGIHRGTMNDDGWTGNPQYITAPSTEDAKRWQGWGSALKPAVEHIVLARKPLEKGLTIAENVLKYGTGGINIDATRIASHQMPKPTTNQNIRGNSFKSDNSERERDTTYIPSSQGRWPANVIFDEAAAAMLDAQSGNLGVSRGGNSKNVGNKIYGKYKDDANGKPCGFGDSGGASRFFYVAKASKSERNAGLEGMPGKQVSHMITGSGKPSESVKERAAEGEPNRFTATHQNHHPTVKPIKLMEYLIRLVTPQGGTVLDPFAGSGTTLVAAKRLGFHYVGIEREKEYCEIAEKRLEAE